MIPDNQNTFVPERLQIMHVMVAFEMVDSVKKKNKKKEKHVGWL